MLGYKDGPILSTHELQTSCIAPRSSRDTKTSWTMTNRHLLTRDVFAFLLFASAAVVMGIAAHYQDYVRLAVSAESC